MKEKALILNRLNNIGIAWEYFLHNPDKTETIVQIYFLNSCYRVIEKLLFSLINFSRYIILRGKSLFITLTHIKI